jgi:hypothetical protein
MAEYIKLDSRKISWREYWNIVPSLLVLIPWGAKLLGIRMKFSSGFPYPESQREFETTAENFPGDALTRLWPLVELCLPLGFHTPRFFRFDTLGGETQTSLIALLHSSGRLSARIFYTINRNPNAPPVINTLVGFLSELQDGTFFFTGNQGPKFKNFPGVTVNRVIGGSPARLLESHQQKLARFEMRNPAKPVNSDQLLDDVWDRYERQATEFGLKRGIYVKMSPDEIAQARSGGL